MAAQSACGFTHRHRLVRQETMECNCASAREDLSYSPPVTEQEQSRQTQSYLIHRPRDRQQAENQQPPHRTGQALIGSQAP